MKQQQQQKKTLRWKKWNEIEWITQEDIESIIYAPIIEEYFHHYLFSTVFSCSLFGKSLSCILFSLAHVYRGPDKPLSWAYALACLPYGLTSTFLIETANPNHIIPERNILLWTMTIYFLYELSMWRHIKYNDVIKKYFISVKSIQYAIFLGCLWKIYSGDVNGFTSVRSLIRTISLHMISNFIPSMMIKFVYDFE